jgi:hypothetical protein
MIINDKSKNFNKISKKFKFQDWEEIHNSIILDCDTIIEKLDFVKKEEENVFLYYKKENAIFLKKCLLNTFSEDYLSYVNSSELYKWMIHLVPNDFFITEPYFTFTNTKNTYMKIYSKYES